MGRYGIVEEVIIVLVSVRIYRRVHARLYPAVRILTETGVKTVKWSWICLSECVEIAVDTFVQSVSSYGK